jgi:hypothetical protein
MEVTVYLVGTDADDAQTNFPFDSEESASSYADDNGGLDVFTCTAYLDFSTIEKVEYNNG